MKHPRARRRRSSLLFVIASTVVLLPPLDGQAQVVHDATLGTPGALSGPNFVIDAGRGAVRGSNLFHSFSQFNIQPGQSATFAPPASGTIRNVLARVTGGSRSTIDGLLRSDIPGANLYLINPAGVIFGPNAQLDVSGSFAVTTADYLKFPDGRFDAATPAKSVLSTAAPSAFGFLSNNAGAIEVQGSDLSVFGEKSLTLVGGPVRITQGRLEVQGGKINIVGVASAGEANLKGGLIGAIDVTPVPQLGDVTVDGSEVTVDGSGEGSIFVQGGSIAILNSDLAANAESASSGGSIDLAARGAMEISDGRITATSDGPAGGGLISLTADEVLLGTGANFLALYEGTASGEGGIIAVRARTFSAPTTAILIARSNGSGGRFDLTADSVSFAGSSLVSAGVLGSTAGSDDSGVRIRAGSLHILDDASISTDADEGGAVGRIVIAANQVLLDGHETGSAHINADANFGAPGGDIEVRADSLHVLNSAFISASGAGKQTAGTIRITAGSVVIDAMSSGGSLTGVFTNTDGLGLGGKIDVRTGSLKVARGGFIGSVDAAGGNVNIRARDVSLEGDGENLTGIVALTLGSERGGDITIRARNLRLENRADITPATLGSGDGGNVVISSRNIALSGQSTISADSEAGQGGNGGNLTITVNDLSLQGGSQISAATDGAGRAGEITISSRTILISDQSSVSTDSRALGDGPFFSPFSRGGNGGNVTLTARFLSLDRDATIAAHTINSGRAGNIQLTADRLRIAHGSAIFASTLGSGRGGDINITTQDLRLTHGAGISPGTGGPGDSGDVRISSRTLSLSDNSRIGAETTQARRSPYQAGDAGSVTIETGLLSLQSDSRISVKTTNAGRAGDIDLSADKVFLCGGRSAISALTRRDGLGGSLSIKAGQMQVTGGALLTSATRGAGAGGIISIDADSLSIRGGGSISTNTTDTGPAGSVMLRTRSTQLHGTRSTIDSSSSGLGNGGEIRIQADDLGIHEGARIASTASGAGAARGISIRANTIGLIGLGSVIDSSTNGPSSGGAIDLTTRSLSIREGGRISSSTSGPGDARGIMIKANDIALAGFPRSADPDDSIVIAARSTGQTSGQAGRIRLAANRSITLRSAQIAVSAENAPAGRIDISSGGNVDLFDSSLTAKTTSQGGDIFLSAVGRLDVNDSLITAQSGSGGRIVIDRRTPVDPGFVILDNSTINGLSAGAPVNVFINPDALFIQSVGSRILTESLALPSPIDIAGNLVPLVSDLSATGSALLQVCAVRFDGLGVSSFIMTTRGGTAPEPGGLMPGLTVKGVDDALRR